MVDAPLTRLIAAEDDGAKYDVDMRVLAMTMARGDTV
jgi:hypothetical protein